MHAVFAIALAFNSPVCHCPSFFFNATATTEFYTLSLHDALPISARFTASPAMSVNGIASPVSRLRAVGFATSLPARTRSEEHTSELQSQSNLVCRLLLEKKKRNKSGNT